MEAGKTQPQSRESTPLGEGVPTVEKICCIYYYNTGGGED